MINGKQFNFQPFEFGDRTGYHIDVNDEDGTRREFSILHADNMDGTKMKLEGTNLPPWIYELQATLIKIINEQE